MKKPTCSYVTNPFSKLITSRAMRHQGRPISIIDWPISMALTSHRIGIIRRWTGSALNRSHDKTGMKVSWDRGTSARRLFSTDGSRASRTTADEGRGYNAQPEPRPTSPCVTRTSSRMRKKTASGVLASLRGSTYGPEYASPLRSLRPCWTAFLRILRGCSASSPSSISATATEVTFSFSATC